MIGNKWIVSPTGWCLRAHIFLQCYLLVTDIEAKGLDQNGTDTEEMTLRNQPERSTRRHGITFTAWSGVLFLSAGLLLLICGIFNLLRYLNDWLAKRGIIAIKTTHTVLPDHGPGLPSYTECIAPPPSYDDVTTQPGIRLQSLPVSFLPSPSVPYSPIPMCSDDVNTNEQESSQTIPQMASSTV